MPLPFEFMAIKEPPEKILLVTKKKVQSPSLYELHYKIFCLYAVNNTKVLLPRRYLVITVYERRHCYGLYD